MSFSHTMSRDQILRALDAQHGRQVAIEILDQFEKEVESQVRSRVGFELAEFVAQKGVTRE